MSSSTDSQPKRREHVIDEKLEIIESGGGNVAAASQPQRFNWRRIYDTPAWYFLALFAIVTLAAVTGNLPPAMMGGFAVTVVLGGMLTWVGNLVPVVRNFGLPTILCTFVPSAMIFFAVMPAQAAETVEDFMTTVGFLDFIVAAIITGAILGMPRTLLVKAGIRFAAPLLGCIVVTLLVIGALGFLIGNGFIESMLYIAAPVLSGGLGVGALPMSEMYSAHLGVDSSPIMSQLMAAVALANIFCVLFAGAINGLGRSRMKMFVGFNGDGQLLRVKGRESELKMPPKKNSATFVNLGKGLMIAAVLYTLGVLLNSYMPVLHQFAWLIIAAALLKIFRLFPPELEDSASEWGDLMTTYFVPALLVGVSIAYIDLGEVIGAITDPVFLGLVVATVVCAALTAGVLGYLVKFYFAEATIVPGLIMADTGGSGDVAVLSAAQRIHLMPFAALATRLGGAFTLFVATLLVPFLG